MKWRKKKWKSIELESFKQNFPPNKVIPPVFVTLLNYQESKARQTRERELSGEFTLCGNVLAIPNYIPPELIPYLAPFGSDADGGTYAFWLYKDFDLESAPVIFLAASWTGNTIVADNLADFLSLLSLGLERIGDYIQFPPDWLDHISNTKEIKQFREWLKAELGVSMPSDPLAIVDTAIKRHPDFGEWLESITGYSPDKLIYPTWD